MDRTTSRARRADASRVTADLPPKEFELLKAARTRDKATTTDIVRALLRLQSADPDLAERLSEEIIEMRIEQAQADLEARRASRRTGGRRPSGKKLAA